MAGKLQVRLFDPERDYPMVASWHQARGQQPTPLAVLPWLGVITMHVTDEGTEDRSAVWLYMDTTGIVCFAEKMVTRPGLTITQTRDALITGLGFLKLHSAERGYKVMTIHAHRGTGRYLKKIGFLECDSGMSCFWSPTSEAV